MTPRFVRNLVPTGDVVEYDPTDVEYPDPAVVSTVGELWVNKLRGFALNCLEVESAGKVAFTLSNEHMLDMLSLDSNLAVGIRGRNQRDVLIDTEESKAAIRLFDTGAINFNTTGDIVYDAGMGDRHAFNVGGNEVMSLDDSGFSTQDLIVSRRLQTPVGTDAERPVSPSTGLIRYNTTSNLFEGYADGEWTNFGAKHGISAGIADADGDTYIETEKDLYSDDDYLMFVTQGAEAMRITSDGNVGVGLSNPAARFHVAGGDLRVDQHLSTGTWFSGESEGGSYQLTPGRVIVGVEASSNGTLLDVTDGDTNDGAGLKVHGVPSGVEASQAAKFDKSLAWGNGSGGMRALATKTGLDSESSWSVRGGHLDIGVVNPSTDGSTSYIWRVNHNDELELHRKLLRQNRLVPVYDKVAVFAIHSDVDVMRDLGGVTVDYYDSYGASNGQFVLEYSAFNAYEAYDLYTLVTDSSCNVTSAEVMASGSLNSNVPAGAPVSISDLAVSDAGSNAVLQTVVASGSNVSVAPMRHPLFQTEADRASGQNSNLAVFSLTYPATDGVDALAVMQAVQSTVSKYVSVYDLSVSGAGSNVDIEIAIGAERITEFYNETYADNAWIFGGAPDVAASISTSKKHAATFERIRFPLTASAVEPVTVYLYDEDAGVSQLRIVIKDDDKASMSFLHLLLTDDPMSLVTPSYVKLNGATYTPVEVDSLVITDEPPKYVYYVVEDILGTLSSVYSAVSNNYSISHDGEIILSDADQYVLELNSNVSTNFEYDSISLLVYEDDFPDSLATIFSA